MSPPAPDIPDEAAEVYDRVAACLANLVGGSGHLTSYRLDRETFAVTARRSLDDGCTAYEFTVEGVAVSEFTGVATDTVDDPEPWEATPGPERLEGTVVLDGDGRLALDSDGRVRIDPWRTLSPEHWR